MAAPAGLTGWLGTRWEHLNGARRIGGVDLARALAVIGMLAAHLLALPEFSVDDSSTWTGIAGGRSSILFATLAGVSIGLVTGGRIPLKGARMWVARGRLAIRGGLLWVLGLLLIATGVPVYVILPAYAILFLLAVPFTALSARTLLLIACGVALVMPFVQSWLDDSPFWYTPIGVYVSLGLGWHYPFLVWIAFILAGMAVARAGLDRRSVLWWMVSIGGALALISATLDQLTGFDQHVVSASPWADVWTGAAHSSGLLEVVGSGGFAVAVIGACVLLCRTPVRWVVLPLRAVGSMPLTAYTAQLVAWAVVAAVVLGDPGDLQGFRELSLFWPFVLWIIVCCTAWALLIGRGPLEWATDRLARLAVRSSRSPGVEDPSTPVDRLNT